MAVIIYNRELGTYLGSFLSHDVWSKKSDGINEAIVFSLEIAYAETKNLHKYKNCHTDLEYLFVDKSKIKNGYVSKEYLIELGKW